MARIFEIENKRKALLLLTAESDLPEVKVSAISEFFRYLLDQENFAAAPSYLAEFIEMFTEYLQYYTAYFKDPRKTEDLLFLLSGIENAGLPGKYVTEISSQKFRISTELERLSAILKGHDENPKGSILFPLLDTEKGITGILETMTIDIKKGNEHDKIILIPSEKEIEKRLNSQVEISLNEALIFVRRIKKNIYKAHQVIIHFNRRAGFYSGDSLGCALTFAFISNLLEFYNSEYSFIINRSTAFTGSVITGGQIGTVGENISAKTEIVFYSACEHFIVPAHDFPEAEKKYKEMLQLYPGRKLILTGAGSIDEIIDRRSIIHFQKKNILLRTSEHVKRNIAFYILFIMLIAAAPFLGIIDLDKNPSIIDYKTGRLDISNKNGKLLWSKVVEREPEGINREIFYNPVIADLDSDGNNEVITSKEFIPKQPEMIRCYNYIGELLWKFSFSDSVVNVKEGFSRTYLLRIIGLTKEDGRNILYIIATNTPNHPTAVLRLDPITGKRLPGEIWHPGHLHAGLINDFNQDGKKELVVTGINNGFEAAAIMSVDLDKIKGSTQFPTSSQYIFLNKYTVEYNQYIVIPKSDLTIYRQERFNRPGFDGFQYLHDINQFWDAIGEGAAGEGTSLIYYFDTDLNPVNVQVGDKFRVTRDSLVVKGELNYPLSDTKEYRTMLLKNIQKIKEKRVFKY